MVFNRPRIEIKSPEQVRLMRVAGLLVGTTLHKLVEAAVPGVSTAELDEVAERSIRGGGGIPSFLGYHGFPASICTSVNEQIVHGIPDGRLLVDGDVISIDCGAIVEGWHGDAAVTVLVGAVDPVVAEMSRVCEQSMWAGIAAVREGGRLSDIGHAVESWAAERGTYGVVEEYTGHGIGTSMHMEPHVPNYGKPGRGPRLVAGMALAVEPMLCLGERYTEVLEDDWTVVTADGRPAVHWEHTVALTPDGPWVLTALDGGAAGLAAHGVTAAAG